ncbi:hypothetical protein [Micromonospora sp. NBRC 101691]|uniref:hypothetical protein n=1 Tax=Micromonospora sp. NBRC 101691 TaxID=3032198 RepID=UPI0025571E9C|nr:hypothetical protein [Micromonospora sp. NBRC 101691]
MPPSPDLRPPPHLLWNRWALFASALAALGVHDVYWCAADGAHHDDHGGNRSRLVLVDGGRAVLFGYDHEYSDTAAATPPIDLLDGAPAWLPWPELLRWQADDQLGYVYWYDDGVWSRVPYPDDVSDGLVATARSVLDAERARLELVDVVFEWGEHGRDDPAERDDVAGAATRLLAAAEARALDAGHLSGLLGRLPADAVDLPAALAVADAAGITPDAVAPPVVPAGTAVPGRRVRALSVDGHEDLVRAAMREESERRRTEPEHRPELDALAAWVRGQAPAGDGRCTLLVAATDTSLATQRGPQPPRALIGETDWQGFRELSGLTRALRTAETHPEEGRWFFLRLTTTPEGHAVERRYDSWPDWYPSPRYDMHLGDLRTELDRRAPRYRPSWAPLLDPEVAWRDVPGDAG